MYFYKNTVYKARLGLRNVFHEPKENSPFDLELPILSWCSGSFSRHDANSPFFGSVITPSRFSLILFDKFTKKAIRSIQKEVNGGR